MSDRSAGPVAYTDGGCLGNPGPGGWGVHVEYPDGRVVELGGGEHHTTNNRMELRAAIEAARATTGWPRATIVTDSQYVRRGITEWIAGWKRKDWVTSTGQPVVNRDLWEELDALADARISWQWTRGHSGDPGNERCDAIASWFSSSIGPLAGGKGNRRALASPTLPRNGSPSAGTAEPSRGVNGSAARTTSRPPRDPGALDGRSDPFGPGVFYVSVVDGIVERHRTWPECERRVKGVKAARFKKVRNAAEEQEVFAKWGLTANDLFGV